MKTTLRLLLLLLLVHTTIFAQQKPVDHDQPKPERNILIKTFDQDSLHIPMSADFYIVEDSCAQLIRRVRFDHQKKTFYGNFTDVSPTDPRLILGQGAYTRDGLKHGFFTSHYTTGKLRAIGGFENNAFTGEWNLFYENGTPKVKFIVENGAVTIQQAWDENGKQIVTDGNGIYEINAGFVTWSGRLVNGNPKGTWRATNPLDRTRMTQLTEKYKNGLFIKGSGPIGPYEDESRISWFDTRDLPYLNAEKMKVSATPCGVTARYSQIVGAHYRNGLSAFSQEISRHVSRAFEGVNLMLYDNEVTIAGEVSEYGRLSNLTYHKPFNESIASAIARELVKVSPLVPATVNGKPVKQKFEINFQVNPGGFFFTYKFLPIDLKEIKTDVPVPN